MDKQFVVGDREGERKKKRRERELKGREIEERVEKQEAAHRERGRLTIYRLHLATSIFIASSGTIWRLLSEIRVPPLLAESN